METLFLVVVVLLLGLAIFDLVVGVSNDAVNFLTSAIGSNAGTFKLVMIVASIGVLIGAASSGGMMEIAKKGVFTPEFFSFQNVIFIYLCVMLSDIFLLDMFNSLRLPTSTTISIVFELLGASLVISYLEVYNNGLPVTEWLARINTAKALQMITAIFVSVAVAFIIGWLIQFILRALVSFNYKRYMRVGGGVFGAISIVVVANFIITVALKNSPLNQTVAYHHLIEYLYLYFGLFFLVAFAIFFILSKNKNFDTFRVITLVGTFALAMAFASNDLVNFVGVPLASLEGYQLWNASGVEPTEFMMNAFNDPVEPGGLTSVLLLLAGAIMVVTLWTSKKARNVIQTTVNLSRQTEQIERFSGNELSRGLVRFITFIADAVTSIMPKGLVQWIQRRYTLPKQVADRETHETPPAFDLVRASVNLMVAAVLISIGTKLKLPLSTTYVSFMVLMGTSLADKAWNRDSAVYRVSGVFTVIGGWFITGISGLVLAGTFAYIVYTYGFVGAGMVLLLVIAGIYLLNRFTNNDLELKVQVNMPREWLEGNDENLGSALRDRTSQSFSHFAGYVDRLTRALMTENRREVKELSKRVDQLHKENFEYRADLTQEMHGLPNERHEAGKKLLDFYVLEGDLIHELQAATRVVREHILNLHRPLDDAQNIMLEKFLSQLRKTEEVFNSEHDDAMKNQMGVLSKMVDDAMLDQVAGMAEERYSYKNGQVFLGTLIRHLNASTTIIRMMERVSRN